MTSTPTRPVDTIVIATKGLQDRNIYIIAGTTMENKGKLILIVNIFYNYFRIRSDSFFHCKICMKSSNIREIGTMVV